MSSTPSSMKDADVGISLGGDVKEPNNKNNEKTTTVSEGTVRPSLLLRMIRHAESQNNQVYRDARYIYRGGTPDFDEEGWNEYVDTHRSADPTLSEAGFQQAQALADWLAPHLLKQASAPVQVVVSPMRRTLETLRPTLRALQAASTTTTPVANILVQRLYHESEGCHTKDQPESGMNPAEIRQVLCQPPATTSEPPAEHPMAFSHFPSDDPTKGWYVHGTGAETRAESERRAAQFYVWLCDHLDQELAAAAKGDEDVFDAGVAIPGEEDEAEHDKHTHRRRKRRTTLLVGHADFMSLVLKRIVGGFGHAVETHGIPHRSAFVHVNTGMTELEYFGQGRFLVMGTNQTPHLDPSMRTGGSLKDGWSYIMPTDDVVLNAEVTVAFEDEMQDHLLEQTEALRALYMGHCEEDAMKVTNNKTLAGTKESTTSNDLSVEEDAPLSARPKHFIVKRGHQVVGVATYSDETGHLTDVAIRPSAGKQVSQALLGAVKSYARGLGRSGSLIVHPRTSASRSLLKAMGFDEVEEGADETSPLQLKE